MSVQGGVAALIEKMSTNKEEDEYTEEEVSADEVDEGHDSGKEEEIAKSVVSIGSVATGGNRTPQPPSPRRAPGKVNPSDAVKAIEMKSPESAGSASVSSKEPPRPALNPAKDPFPVFGAWDAKSISEISIIFGDLNSRRETTNAKTRENNPDKRFWKAPITFKYGSFTSDTIRFNNVQIPYAQGTRNYGTSFVYACLPMEVGRKFADAGKAKRPTKVDEPKLVPDQMRWWKALNGIEGAFGISNSGTKKFHAKPLDTIFEGTGKGITVNLVLKFVCKASTDNNEPLRPTTACRVAAEVVRGYIVNMGVDVEPPTKIVTPRVVNEPVSTTRDLATDDLSKRLAALGI